MRHAAVCIVIYASHNIAVVCARHSLAPYRLFAWRCYWIVHEEFDQGSFLTIVIGVGTVNQPHGADRSHLPEIDHHVTTVTVVEMAQKASSRIATRTG